MNVGIAEIRNKLADALNRVAYQGERVVLERRGKGVAAIVSIDDLELLEAIEDREDVRAAKRTLAEMKRKGEKPIPLSEIIGRLGQPSRSKAK
ncbi:MAG TPA: type II toxin-antitoxin system Phd/YefM family antitoxin [Planctomycetaceae bacterium]|jgi:prevent-host-death family protein